MNLDQALRDAAEPVPPRVAEPPAQALLDRIVTSSAHPVPAPVGLRRAARQPRRATIAVLAAAVAVTAALILPNVGSNAAFASWTPQPSPLAAAEQDELADRCVTSVAAEYRHREADPARRIVHGERRGDYAYVSVVTGGWTASCFRDRDGALRNGSVMAEPVDAATLGDTGVELQGWPQLRSQEGYCRLLTGHVGSQVVGVDVTVRDRTGDHARTVHATVENGYFLAWYPEGLDEADSNTTSLTLRLSDGGLVEGLSARDLMNGPRVN
jgi:hypothetical protein